MEASSIRFRRLTIEDVSTNCSSLSSNYDLLGRKIAVPSAENMGAQSEQTIMLFSRRASGSYFIRVTGDCFRATEGLVVLQ